MPQDRYTLGEVAELFGRQLKTIERWVKRAGMDVGKDEQDRRYRFLNKTQVDHLAQLHRVQLRAKETTAHKKETEQQEAIVVLRTELRASMKQEVSALERRIIHLEQQLATLRTDLLARIEALEARPAAPPVSPARHLSHHLHPSPEPLQTHWKPFLNARPSSSPPFCASTSMRSTKRPRFGWLTASSSAINGSIPSANAYAPGCWWPGASCRGLRCVGRKAARVVRARHLFLPSVWLLSEYPAPHNRNWYLSPCAWQSVTPGHPLESGA